MYLFSRTRSADPTKLAEAVGWAGEAARYVTKVTGIEVSPWGTVYGQPTTSLSWSCRIESAAVMAAAQEKLVADTGYQKMLEQASKLFVGPSEDFLTEFVSIVGTPNTGKFATVTRAQCAHGHIAQAMAWGVDILHHVEKVTALPGSMVRAMYGPWGQLGWISLADSMAQVDAAVEATAADATYLERVDMGGPLFITGSATHVLLRSLA